MKVKLNLKSGYQYTVQLGDSLFSIAKQKYGRGELWPKIYNYKNNKNVIGKDPNHIEAFSKIELW